MTLLVFVTAAFLAGAAVLKARASTRLGVGVSLLVVLEGVGAIALLVVGLPGPLSGSVIARGSVPAAMLLLLVSTVDHMRRLKGVRDRRDSTEGGRLAAYVRYQSRALGGDSNGESGTGGEQGTRP